MASATALTTDHQHSQRRQQQQATVLERVVMTAEQAVLRLSKAGGVRLATNLQVGLDDRRVAQRVGCVSNARGHGEKTTAEVLLGSRRLRTRRFNRRPSGRLCRCCRCSCHSIGLKIQTSPLEMSAVLSFYCFTVCVHWLTMLSSRPR